MVEPDCSQSAHVAVAMAPAALVFHDCQTNPTRFYKKSRSGNFTFPADTTPPMIDSLHLGAIPPSLAGCTEAGCVDIFDFSFQKTDSWRILDEL